MSSRKSDHYNTLEGYGTKKTEKGPYKRVDERRPTDTAPAPTPTPAPSQQQNNNQQEEKQTRVSFIEHGKLHNLLTRPEFNTRDGVPLKILLTCYAPWCKPCHLLGPKMDDISMLQKYSNIVFLKMDVTEIIPELQNLLQLQAVPMIFGFLGNNLVGQVAGASINEIEELCDKLSVL